MRVTLDPSFDAGSWPGPLSSRAAAAGEAWLGPTGFLGTLETLLGLAGRHASAAERSASLIARLQKTDGFWSASTAADPLATAHLLVSWRDGLALEGWTGEPVSERLVNLAEVTGGLRPGLAERLRAVTDEVRSTPPVLDTLVLFEPPHFFPRLWCELFEALKLAGTDVSEVTPSAAEVDPKSDLFRSRGAAFVPAGDRSLQLIRAYGPLEAADAVAAALAADPDVQTVIIGADPLLDAALHRYGLPTTGAAGSASDNALLQVLPLVLALGWKPADPQRAVELLTLERGPVPRAVAGRLIGALNEWPAVDSDGWREALAEGLECIEPESRQSVADRLAVLLNPTETRPKFRVSEIRRRVAVLRDWLQKRGGAEENDLAAGRFAGAGGQCDALSSLAELAGVDELQDAQLSRFLEEATAPVASGALHPAQAGFGAVGLPGGLAGPAPRVVWWNFDSEAAVVPHRMPFTGAERAALAQHGVNLPDAATLARREVARWRRPLLQATRTAWLVCPQWRPNGDAAEPHPIWDEVVGHLAPQTNPDALVTKSPRLSTPVPQKRRKTLPLLGARSSWQTGAQLKARPKESPNSISTLMGCSLRWALRYVGELYGSGTASLPGGALVLGKLAHRLIERVMRDKKRTPEEAKGEVERLFDTEGPRLFASLFLPGQSHDREDARRATAQAAKALAELRDEGWEPESIEMELEGKAFGTIFAGTPDLVVTRGDARAVLDLKWSGRRHHLRALTEGTALQLAAYAALLHQTTKSWPHVSYFIVREARLLAGSLELAGSSKAVSAVSPEDSWTAVKAGYETVWKAASAGMLQAPGAREDALEEAQLVDSELQMNPQCQYCDYPGLCGRRYGLEASDDDED